MLDGGLVFYKWKDNKNVTLLPNFHWKEVTKLLKKQKDGTRNEFNYPIAVEDFNAYMSGVDKADLLISSYITSKKSNIVASIFFSLVDRAFINWFSAFNKITGVNMKNLTFRRMVAQLLIIRGCPPKVGWPLLSATTLTTSKRRKLLYSKPPRIRKENLSVLWPKYNSRGGSYEFCPHNKQELRTHIQCTWSLSLLKRKEKLLCRIS